MASEAVNLLRSFYEQGNPNAGTVITVFKLIQPQSLTGSQCKGSKWFSNSCRDEHIAGPLFLKFKLMTGNASVVFFGAQLMLIVLYPRYSTHKFPFNKFSKSFSHKISSYCIYMKK
ncbi:uncharacterized protein LOC111366311 [Olea europaea var. sylvestris]|uniref:uncharacterized protein LOC111366311 n=1 Tax=Olea europaea var. sylvestris TaxID=158386 RepID=UPI000C1D1506|nr:uncharacterized protein LOC111366311 [Olea europaea var. sylvestris]